MECSNGICKRPKTTTSSPKCSSCGGSLVNITKDGFERRCSKCGKTFRIKK